MACQNAAFLSGHPGRWRAHCSDGTLCNAMPSELTDKIIRIARQRRVPNSHQHAVSAQRAAMRETTARLPVPARLQSTELTLAGVPCVRFAMPEARADGLLVFLHGGGYALGSARTHTSLCADLSTRARLPVLAVDYRLAPEHPFPAAVHDVCAVLTALVEQGHSPSRLVLGGDSAGGGLTFATMLQLLQQGQPLPTAAFALSPWTDLTGTARSLTDRAERDPTLEVLGVHRFAGMYASGRALDDPLISPLYADLRGLPPTLIQVGTEELLYDDAVRMDERLRAAGVDAQLEVHEGLFHVFQSIVYLPESQQANQRLADFMRSHLS